MFDSLASCSCRSTPPTVSSSSSRRDGARSPRRRRRGRSSRSSASGDARTLAARRRRRGRRRLAWVGAGVGSRADAGQTAIEEAELVVLDLETTGLSASRDRICEIGAVRIRALEVVESFETLVRPGTLLPAPSSGSPASARRTCEERRARRPPCAASSLAGDAPLAAHNARFDLGFLDREVERLTGRRVAAPVVDTVWLARRLLQARSARFSLLQLAHFFGTSAQPRHRALPDALATAEILVALLGLAQERGARTPRGRPRARGAARSTAARETVADGGCALLAGRVPLPRPERRCPLRGQGRDLRARLRSYFSGDRQRPSVEAALGALERIEWRPARVGARGCSRGAASHP